MSGGKLVKKKTRNFSNKEEIGENWIAGRGGGDLRRKVTAIFFSLVSVENLLFNVILDLRPSSK